jgi:hypothetical protein
VVIHFLNNASALALVNLAGLETPGDPALDLADSLPAVTHFVLSAIYYARRSFA